MPKRAISDEEMMAAVNAEVGTAREVLRFVHGRASQALILVWQMTFAITDLSRGRAW